jgi:sugar diacid utilization regulator
LTRTFGSTSPGLNRFANLGKLARTAAALLIHSNTLLYRLGRIAEISGLNLDDAEERWRYAWR